ncbi:MAG: calcium-binding protein [Magnetospiraceae bacterium]
MTDFAIADVMLDPSILVGFDPDNDAIVFGPDFEATDLLILETLQDDLSPGTLIQWRDGSEDDVVLPIDIRQLTSGNLTFDASLFIIGENSADTIGDDAANSYDFTGSSQVFGFNGLGEADDFVGGTSDDVLIGGDGADTLNGSLGNDYIRGDGDDDSLIGGAGNDEIIGGAGADTLKGDTGNDTLSGKAGADVIFGGLGLDTIDGGADNDTIRGEFHDDSILGNFGDDRIFGGTGNDTLKGGGDQDILEGELGADKIHGNEGNDTLRGGDGADSLVGGTGDDSLLGGTGADTLFGDDGNDTLVGQDGNDRLSGGSGADRVFGGIGNDTLTGEGGNDTLFGRAGIDRIVGGAGDDSVLGGTGVDSINGSIGDDVLRGNQGDDTLNGDEGNDRLYGGSASDVLIGGEGNDQLWGRAGDDDLAAGNGADLLRGGTGNDTMAGRNGNDTLFGGIGDDILAGGTGSDRLVGRAGNDTVLGLTGSDFMYGGTGDDSMDGGLDADVMDGGRGADTLRGGGGDDSIVGGSGDDYLEAGTGDDTLVAGPGFDTLVGSAGTDTYVVSIGGGIIEGFTVGDTIVVPTQSYEVVVGADGAVIQFFSGEEVSVVGASITQVAAAIQFDPNTPFGSTVNFQINTNQANLQYQSTMAEVNNGDLVAVWQAANVDGSGFAIQGQIFDDTGTALDVPFQINSTVGGDQLNPAVAETLNDGFVVVWQSALQDGDGLGIFGQYFDRFGAAVGSEFQVNQTIADDQREPDVASFSTSKSVVVWESEGQDGSGGGIYAQLVRGDGTLIGTEILVNQTTGDDQSEPSVSVLTNNAFVVTWTSANQDGSSLGIFGRIFDVNGNALTSEFQVNTYTANAQSISTVEALDDGGFVVAWNSFGQDGSDLGTFSQIFDSTGGTVGSEFQVSRFYSQDAQGYTDLSAIPGGGFVAVWQSFGQDGDDYGVFGQVYSSIGQLIGGEFQVNTDTVNTQWAPSVAVISDSQFAVAWEAEDEGGTVLGISGSIFDIP